MKKYLTENIKEGDTIELKNGCEAILTGIKGSFLLGEIPHTGDISAWGKNTGRAYTRRYLDKTLERTRFFRTPNFDIVYMPFNFSGPYLHTSSCDPVVMDREYLTRGGNRVRIHSIDNGGKAPVHGAVEEHGSWYTCQWTKEGRNNNTSEHSLDLIPAKKKAVQYVYLHPDGCTTCSSNKIFSKDVIASARVELVEGDFHD